MWNPYQPLSFHRSLALKAGGLLTVLVTWALVAGFDIVPDSKLVGPWDVLTAWIDLLWDDPIPGFRDPGPDASTWEWFMASSPIISAAFYSSLRVALAWIGVAIFGGTLGILMGGTPAIDAFFSWVIDPFRSSPLMALLPLFVLWFSFGETSKILFLWTSAVVFFIPMVRDAIKAVPSEYYIMWHDLGGTPWESFRRSNLSLARPRIWDGQRTAISIMWTYITAAELVNSSSGIGMLVSYSKRSGRIDYILASIGTIILLALATEIILVMLKARLFHWEENV